MYTCRISMEQGSALSPILLALCLAPLLKEFDAYGSPNFLCQQQHYHCAVRHVG
jgi:hypothetical protein